MRARSAIAGLFRRFRRDRSGANALEFAVVAPPLLFLIIGILQVSMALYKGSTVQWVAERELRQAMISNEVSSASLQQSIQEELRALGDDFQVVVDFQVDNSGAVPVGRVRVDYNYPVVLPLMDTFQAQFSVDTSVPMPS